MPWATYHFTRPTVDELADAGRAQEAERVAGTQRPALVRAAIQQGKEIAAHVEDADRPAGDVDELALARWDLLDGANHPLGHASDPPASLRSLRAGERGQQRFDTPTWGACPRFAALA